MTLFFQHEICLQWLPLAPVSPISSDARTSPTKCPNWQTHPISETIGIQFVCLFYEWTNWMQLIMYQSRANACTNKVLNREKKRNWRKLNYDRLMEFVATIIGKLFYLKPFWHRLERIKESRLFPRRVLANKTSAFDESVKSSVSWCPKALEKGFVKAVRSLLGESSIDRSLSRWYIN